MPEETSCNTNIPDFMHYLVNYTGCNIPRMENWSKVYTICMLQLYKISYSENDLFLFAM